VYGEENYETLEGADALLRRPEQRLFRRPDFPRMKKLLKTITSQPGCSTIVR